MHLPPKGLYLSPMVRGSELAMRMLARESGNASLCYSPMLRDRDVLSVHEQWQKARNSENPHKNRDWKKNVHIDSAGRTNSVDETAYLLIHDACPEEDVTNCVIQLCGSFPDSLGRATDAVLDLYHNQHHTLPAGIDLNLGCPQQCALDEGFGAFLVEKDPSLAISCIASMRNALDSYCRHKDGRIPTLSAKIRLMKTVESTIEFIQQLHQAGLDYIAIHCRHRVDKHSGNADWDAGRRIVDALSSSLPIILNGGITDLKCANALIEQTNCHAVMIASGYLHNHRNFFKYNNKHDEQTITAFEIACEYIDYAEKYPPPSYLYIQKHLRWILRDVLQPIHDPNFDRTDYSDSRVKLWSFLVRAYLRTIEQFRLFMALYLKLGCEDGVCNVPAQISELIDEVTFKSVKMARVKKL
eukprot:scaffold31296_cov62-Cyclotella_meneghiniana.AAC.6